MDQRSEEPAFPQVVEERRDLVLLTERRPRELRRFLGARLVQPKLAQRQAIVDMRAEKPRDEVAGSQNGAAESQLGICEEKLDRRVHTSQE